MDTLLSRPQTVRPTSITRTHLHTSTSAARGVSGATCSRESRAVRMLVRRQALWRSPRELSRVARSMPKETAQRKAQFCSNVAHPYPSTERTSSSPEEDTPSVKTTDLDTSPKGKAETGGMFAVVSASCQCEWDASTDSWRNEAVVCRGTWHSSLDAARNRYIRQREKLGDYYGNFHFSKNGLRIYDSQGRVLDEEAFGDLVEHYDLWEAMDSWRTAHLEDACDSDIQLRGQVGSRPYVVVWHVRDHAEGMLFGSLTEAEDQYSHQRSIGRWATRLYDPDGNILQYFGGMTSKHWAQLDEWREVELESLGKTSEGTIDVEASECAEAAPAGGSAADAMGSVVPIGVPVHIVNVKDAEAFYACRHSVAPARNEDGTPSVRGFQRMVSTWHDAASFFSGTDQWVFEALSDGNFAIKNVHDEEYLVSSDHKAQSSLNRDSNINFCQRMITTLDPDSLGNKISRRGMEPSVHAKPATPYSIVKYALGKIGSLGARLLRGDGSNETVPRILRGKSFENGKLKVEQLPDSARWSLKPAPGGRDRYYIVNVETGEALYSCRHSAMSEETASGRRDNTMDRRMVSTVKCNTPSGHQEGPLENTDVWFLPMIQGSFSLESFIETLMA